MDLGILLFAFTAVFHLITLPVEFNASRRAVALLEGGSYISGDEVSGTRQVLSAAALTYVASAAVATPSAPLNHPARQKRLNQLKNGAKFICHDHTEETNAFTIQCQRPYTVLVAVVLVIVLDHFFTGMTTDLLPDIELPYIVVFTSYPGASPEQVEQAVTRPLESTRHRRRAENDQLYLQRKHQYHHPRVPPEREHGQRRDRTVQQH